jgi:CRISPR-associated protein Cas5d
LAIYTFLADVEYQVRAHFEWNLARPELEQDRNEHKHHNIARRMLERGGRQDIFLGTRDCQGYVEPCEFGSGPGHYDGAGELAFSLMFHGFDYPDETGDGKLHARFWRPTMEDGFLRFDRPDNCPIRKLVRPMTAKKFGIGRNVLGVEDELKLLEVRG